MRIVRWLAAAWALAAFAQLPNADLVQPEKLAARLSDPSVEKPSVLFVGFTVLYRGGHIPGAVLAGPASKPEGLDLLRQAVAKLQHDHELVIYCGCCPFDRCPNVRPAFAELHKMGFTKVSVLSIPENMAKDWISKGYPFERPVERPGK
jgi:thiosulfate/3-mercaptopyruvate sulfurtransferase